MKPQTFGRWFISYALYNLFVNKFRADILIQFNNNVPIIHILEP